MKMYYENFKKFIAIIEYLEDNQYGYSWKQICGGYQVTINY